jgi:predicted ATPase
MGTMPAVKEPKAKLLKLDVRGFKSIRDQSLTLSNLDVLIGANGAGKSNLIAFLRMISFMLSSDAGLAGFVARAGGANLLLYNGSKQTREIEGSLCVETLQGRNEYMFRLGYAAGDTFVFLDEKCRFSASASTTPNRWIEFGAGHRAPQILKARDGESGRTRRTILKLLQGLSVYQFHDTSDAALVKQRQPLSDNGYLKSDARNLAPFLLGMRDREPEYYQRLVKMIRLLAPFLEDFILDAEFDTVLLNWRDKTSGMSFGPAQLSDGTVRVIALLALLMQPPKNMPQILVLDEPELGLHPYAIHMVAGAIKAASQTNQCLIATQSPALLNELSAENVLVAERHDDGSHFRRLDSMQLASWLEDYELSELWDMNLLGGRPGQIAAE